MNLFLKAILEHFERHSKYQVTYYDGLAEYIMIGGAMRWTRGHAAAITNNKGSRTIELRLVTPVKVELCIVNPADPEIMQKTLKLVTEHIREGDESCTM